MGNKSWLGGVACALAMGAAGAWMLFGRGHSSTPEVAVVAQTGTGTAGASAGIVATNNNPSTSLVRVKRDASGAAMQWPPLPSIDAPFASTAGELRRRADAGDPKAACRLAAEVDRCSRVKEQIVALDARMRRMQDNPQANQRQRRGGPVDLVGAGERMLAEDARCQGAPELAPMEKYGYLRQAALAGHIPAMVEYATGNVFRMRDTLESLPALATYRVEAEALARRAAASGDAGAMMALASAYSPDRNEGRPGLLMQVVKPDAAESLALYLQLQQQLAGETDAGSTRMRRFVEQQVSRLQELATPAQRAEAEARVQQRAAQWSPASFDPESLQSGRIGELKPELCDKDNFVR